MQRSEHAASRSGVDMRYVDATVRPQDDLYRYLNGRWLDEFILPGDKASYGAFSQIDDATQEQLLAIVHGLGAAGCAEGDADGRKLTDLYASFMDEARLESLGGAPLLGVSRGIDMLGDARDVARLIARFNRLRLGAPFAIDIDPDPKDSTRYAVIVDQGGLGLPDRDYYLSPDAPLGVVRERYLAHVERLLGLAGEADPGRDAGVILELETALARLQWTRVANRDPEKTYHKVAIAELELLMPAFDWPGYLEAGGILGRVDSIIVRQPDYLQGLGRLLSNLPLSAWKSYFKWQLLAAAAPWLSKAFVEERFAFSGTVLRGIPDNRPRWKRGLELLDRGMGEALGRLYVARHFPPRHKARMQALVRNLLDAYRGEIGTLEWMGAETKVGALAKLANMVTKIGYPDTWRDYGALEIVQDDLWGNIARIAQFEHQRGIDKLGKPIDRDEWFMPPQTVNAYYNPVMNEIVFPAAILQPPFFDADADDAANYGGIVAVIGHEVSHGFDDQGSRFDADGNLRDWFAPLDHARFAAKTRALVAQYAAYEAVAGASVDGELTLGENIADNSGLAIAYKAYLLALGRSAAPVIDGWSGAQRFYLGWAQVWRAKVRRDEALQRIKTDVHAPPAVRGSAPLKNQEGFQLAFGVQPGDRMYLAPGQRVTIW